MDNPRALALVVNPQIVGHALNKVIMDGGSRINIIYYNTFRCLGLSDNQLQFSATTFHGIIPGKSARPVGRVSLEVTFGDITNFHSKVISFKVVKIQSPYHAIFGRAAYIKSMARPYYTYLKLKMPGPHGVITVQGSHDIALACEKNGATYAEAACNTEHHRVHRKPDIEDSMLESSTALKEPESPDQ